MVRSRIADADPKAEVFMMRGIPATVVGVLALGADSVVGRRYQLVVRADRLEVWAAGFGPSLEVTYSRVESAARTVRQSFAPMHGVELLVRTDGPALSLPLFPYERADVQAQYVSEQLVSALSSRGISFGASRR